MPARYDLHTHSLLSDGTTRPAEIAQEAAEIGLAGFALTDHDTVDGWDEAREAAAAVGIDFLPGIEVTTRHGWRSRHLLGYGLDPAVGGLLEALAKVRDHRLTRAREMVDLIAADYSISWDEVARDEDVRTVGRPHIADALVSRGYFVDRTAAFDDVLHPRSPYYIPTYAIETVDAIRLVREAGGVPVLAHPAAKRQRYPFDLADLPGYVEAGLWGIELDHPENREDWLPPLREAAAEHKLEVTGASDYHGAGKPNRLGERTSPAGLVERLRAAIRQ